MAPQNEALDAAPVVTTSHVVFLSANDVYKLLPDDEGLGGIAQFATLLDRARSTLPRDAHVIVTLNGDFFWRTELEPPYKAELMVDILRALHIDYVVLGNHEFDFGAQRCRELLPTIDFAKVFGSNTRLRDSGALFPGVTDHEIITLPQSGMKLGFFGVLTSNPHEFVVSNDPLVVFESEVTHAKRCVRALQAAGADAIVALTHTRLHKDRLIARQVPGIHLMLGGHDHEPYTMFEKTTLIHKSGCDALWLAQVDLFLQKETDTSGTSHVDVQFGWRMIPNRQCAPRCDIQRLLDAFFARVASDATDPAMELPLAVAHTRLDGSRLTLRCHESNLGNLVADAIRVGMDADVAFINGGFIQCERKFRPGLVFTRSLLRTMLPIPNTARCVAVPAANLRLAFSVYLHKYPDESSTMPHVSGVFLDYEIDTTTNKRTLKLYFDRDHKRPVDDATVVRVACSGYMFDEAEGREHFQEGETVANGDVIQELVATFLTTHLDGNVTYAAHEGRVAFREV